MKFHEKTSAFFGIGVFVHVGVEITELSQETGEVIIVRIDFN